MEQKENKKYQIIGACVSMQKISLEEEFKLIDGILYDIDFTQDFSEIYWNGNLLSDISIPDIIDTVVHPKETLCYDSYIGEDRRNIQEFWAYIDKVRKMERRKEEKWKKKRAKNQKEALRNFERALTRLK